MYHLCDDLPKQTNFFFCFDSYFFPVSLGRKGKYLIFYFWTKVLKINIKAADGRARSVKYLLILIDKDKVFVTNSQSSAHALSCFL